MSAQVQLKPLRILRQPTSSTLTKVRSIAARLPPELCDMIIDFLYDEKPVLSICTLVCRAWLRAARYHLFDSIYVHCEKNLDAFHDFLAYLQSTPSVRAYIKDLCLDGFTEVPEPPDNMESCYLAAIAELLPQIHTMSVINCQWGPQKNDVLRLKQIPLRSLYINSFVADNEIHKDKFRVLRQFSHIGHLHLANVWLGHFALDENETDLTEQGGDTKLLPSTRVKALSLSMANICLNFLECLRLQSFVRTLSSLRIIDLFHAEYLQEHQDLIYVGELLRGPISTSLLELHLELPRLSRHGMFPVNGSC
ncbi:hypothetical protein PHLGIDRAFT_288540 [Phlebiopsis gigantea 11061_1 CR5-6]|uniref:F-box domain-containing protein n=1 Tax=Phlebiopsis gigantea (strain 11061_1 CR5-6) TaxID=745531 RepID=A0A0C3NWX5_PHLG1|nr:hypothetical protein PHLGIDRAFT_288540 [Phlebiopsis gigantea 11061_1 CR5-6]